MDSDDASPIHVFVSYAHADRKWLDRLQIHLKSLRELCELEPWDDTRLKSGSRWRREIRAAVDRASVAVLLISADFLASDFVRTDELPPLLEAAAEEGTLILPIIVSPCLFLRTQHLSQFQTINDPARPLVMVEVAEQEAAFVRVAEAILEVAPRKKAEVGQTASASLLREDFLEVATWRRLLKIGDWILDENRARILGARPHAFLLSREEYGDIGFELQTVLKFSNFAYPDKKRSKLGMNAGLVFGWRDEKQRPRYYNVVLTGSEIFLERNDLEAPPERKRSEHLTDPVPLLIEPDHSIEFVLRLDDSHIRVSAKGKGLIEHNRPAGVVGRVGLRPWRSQLECTSFTVTADASSQRLKRDG